MKHKQEKIPRCKSVSNCVTVLLQLCTTPHTVYGVSARKSTTPLKITLKISTKHNQRMCDLYFTSGALLTVI